MIDVRFAGKVYGMQKNTLETGDRLHCVRNRSKYVSVMFCLQKFMRFMLIGSCIKVINAMSNVVHLCNLNNQVFARDEAFKELSFNVLEIFIEINTGVIS